MTHPQIGRALRLMNMERNGATTVAQFEALLTDTGRTDAFIELLQRPGALQQIVACSDLFTALFTGGAIQINAASIASVASSADGLRILLSDADILAGIFAVPAAKAALLASTALVPASVPQMTGDTDPSGVASASTFYSAGYEAWRAFDGDIGTHWQTSGSQPIDKEWVAYKFNSPAFVSRIAITQTYDSYRIQSCDIQRSMDGVVFSTAASVTFLDIEEQSVEVNASGFYPHWRIKVNSDYGSGYCVVHGISFSGFLE